MESITEVMESTKVRSRYEAERGKPMPSLNHAIVQKRLLVKLDSTYGEQFEVLPEVNVAVTPKRDRVPDLTICKEAAFSPGHDRPHLTEPPLCVIEILSPKQNLSELINKSTEYFEMGVPSYWLVIPELRTVHVFHQPGESRVFTHRDTLRDESLEVELDLGEVFR